MKMLSYYKQLIENEEKRTNAEIDRVKAEHQIKKITNYDLKLEQLQYRLKANINEINIKHNKCSALRDFIKNCIVENTCRTFRFSFYRDPVTCSGFRSREIQEECYNAIKEDLNIEINAKKLRVKSLGSLIIKEELYNGPVQCFRIVPNDVTSVDIHEC